MRIDKGDIFYRYADNYNPEDNTHEIEVYVSITRSKKKSDYIKLINIESGEGYEILNGDIGGTDLVYLTPDYHFNFGFVGNELALYLVATYKKKPTLQFVTEPFDPIYDKIYNTANICEKLAGYKFLSKAQIELVLMYCYDTEDLEILSELAEAVMVYNMSILNAVDLPNTVLNGVKLECSIANIFVDNNPDLKEFEDAIRMYCEEEYVILPFTPAYEVEKITKTFRIVRLADNMLYILMYVPTETYLDRGCREDPEVQEVYDMMCKNI